MTDEQLRQRYLILYQKANEKEGIGICDEVAAVELVREYVASLSSKVLSDEELRQQFSAMYDEYTGESGYPAAEAAAVTLARDAVVQYQAGGIPKGLSAEEARERALHVYAEFYRVTDMSAAIGLIADALQKASLGL